MVQKFQKNVIDNPNDEKFKTIKSANPKVREALTKYYHGVQLVKLVGF